MSDDDDGPERRQARATGGRGSATVDPWREAAANPDAAAANLRRRAAAHSGGAEAAAAHPAGAAAHREVGRATRER